MLRAFPLLVSLLVAGVLAGCGGDGEGGDDSQGLVAEADAICAEYGADAALLETRFDEALTAGDLDSAATDLRDQAARVTEMLDRLADLGLPAAQQSTIDQLVELGRQRVSTAQEAADAIASGDGEQTVALGRKAMDISGEYYRFADSLGFNACGTAGQAAQP